MQKQVVPKLSRGDTPGRVALFALRAPRVGPLFVGRTLLYGSYGTLDIVLLSHKIHAEPETLVTAALMTTGLLAKAALFPLHLWLPPAHAGAPSPASAAVA